MGTKIVLDTNVFVSAIGWKGASREIFKDCIEGNLELFISTEIFDEIKRVLNHPKFKFDYPFEARPQRVASLFPEAVRETALRFLTGMKMDSKIKIKED